MPLEKFPDLPSKDELDIDEATGYPIPPEGIRVYANGAGFYVSAGALAYGPGTFSPDNTGITSSERSNELLQARYDKAEQAVRDGIKELTGKEMVEAFGEASAILWKEVVLNPDESGRTRVDAHKELGKRGGIVPDRDRAFVNKHGASLKVEGLTPEILASLRALIESTRSAPEESPPEADDSPPVIDSSFQ